MDPFFLAVSRYKRQRYDECIEICTQMLDKNPYDQVTKLLEFIVRIGGVVA
jgi:tetratricopeptide repeat protein 8